MFDPVPYYHHLACYVLRARRMITLYERREEAEQLLSKEGYNKMVAAIQQLCSGAPDPYTHKPLFTQAAVVEGLELSRTMYGNLPAGND